MDRTVEPNQPSDLLTKGHQQWQRKWSVFASQWTQPQLMKLAQLALGENCLHSSQIKGFCKGKISQPGPKVLMVIGYLNLAIAAANGDEEAMATTPYTLPLNESRLFFGKSWMQTPEGKPLGPVDVFQAFCGIIDLQCDGDIGLDATKMEPVSKSLGKFVRQKLMEQGIDFMDSDVIKSWDQPELIQKLIFSKTLDAAELEQNLDCICTVIKENREAVIELGIKPALSKDTK